MAHSPELIDEMSREQIKFTRIAVGLALIGLGGFSLVVGIFFAIFTNKSGAFIGTNGLLVWSTIMLAVGITLRVYRIEDAEREKTLKKMRKRR